MEEAIPLKREESDSNEKYVVKSPYLLLVFVHHAKKDKLKTKKDLERLSLG